MKRSGAGLLGMTVFSGFTPGLRDSIRDKLEERSGLSPREIARDEDFWATIQRAYKQSSHFINLESGYFSPEPTPVLESRIDNIRMINEAPSFYMRRRQEEEKAEIKRIMGEFAGCSPDEFVISRNATEALDTIILGLELEPGAEALMCDREYPSMKEAFGQRQRRHGLKIKMISVPLVPESQDEVVRIYEEAITPATRVILVSHMIYLTGQILPVRAIADMAHLRNIEVIVDAAHSFAHLDFRIPDLGADYVGTSLHKWLGAPLGTGLMYVRKEKISRVWPLFGDNHIAENDIRKFEHIGTHPCSANLSIVDAIDFHRSIGSKRKEERLRFLKNYWVEKVAGVPGIVINTPLGDDQSCAIANVAIEGKASSKVVNTLWNDDRIFTVAVEQGARIAPNLWTRLDHLDRLAEGLKRQAEG
jgi:selenocysteine lyase/cysteine desulfurase